MAETGIGFAGVDGAWWRPAVRPFALPASARPALEEIGRALFALFDAVAALYGTPEGAAGGLDALLTHQVPAHLPRLVSPARVLSLRPDFQLVPRPDGGFAFVATELEMCPSAHGFAHALQVGYGLEPDLAPAFARLLAGRELWFVGTEAWSEFLIEQLAFCRALADHGARARVLYDRPLGRMAREFKEGRRWQPPMFGLSAKPPGWDDDLPGRLRARDLLRFMAPDETWPETLGDSVVFRFGYFDCFTPDRLRRFQAWESAGATPLNPTTFYLESKAVMAAARLPGVRARLAADLLRALDRAVPETIVLKAGALEPVLDEPDRWVLKFAGFDGGQQAWGGRSLQIGADHTRASWADAVRGYAALPWPTVAQRLTATARLEIDYLGGGEVRTLRDASTRLRVFLVRQGEAAVACGAHLTAAAGAAPVSEAADAVQAPVIFKNP